ncbi:hypothetical protein HBI25_233920 [Parastagonospora nodorum]|nr:hypothetical protein HBH50_046360 [Parastagonospora nodorum]KAH4082027.1 hypothetical protein HBH48_188790 [Parastagonospora nodorum]KAH4863367.1 hypothetical protein HBH75_011190 [Parastagonospora nodorum]KAH5124095.1 hypothetical protein HBH71_033230 [Parastagonospora nodorum]KAH5356326.1 hypothetical protein HBI49_159010 [Parastagonospora nodorum]
MRTYNLIFASLLTSFIPQGLAALVPSPAARAVLPRSQPTQWSLPHRVTVNGEIKPSRRNLELEAKRQAKQIPFAFCPEFFKEDPKQCSMCGGDSKVKGTCNNLLVSGDQSYCPGGKPCRGYYCRCSDNGGPDNSPKVTMTSVVNGETGTVIWEPMTLDEYKGLRASTTVSLTETATASGANGGLETVAAVVFAGGVAWYLASQNAAAAAIVFQPPPQKPEGSREDDNTCKNNGNKPDCDDCGGNTPLGLCSKGDKQNCPCEEQNCPKDGPPKCSAQDCSGSNEGLKCNANGQLKGCQCCPAEAPTCDADDCKGDDKDKCQADKFKGCGCEAPEFDRQEPEPDEPFPEVPSSDTLLKQAKESLDKIWGGDKSKVPGYKKEDTGPYCLYGAAPRQVREPKEYCQCGDNHATMWYVKPSATNPCPWTPEETGSLITFTTPAAAPPPTPTPTPPAAPPPPPPPPEPKPSTKPCVQGWCGAPFCSPLCKP